MAGGYDIQTLTGPKHDKENQTIYCSRSNPITRSNCITDTCQIHQWFCHLVCTSYISGSGGDHWPVFWHFSILSGRICPIFTDYLADCVFHTPYKRTNPAHHPDVFSGCIIIFPLHHKLRNQLLRSILFQLRRTCDRSVYQRGTFKTVRISGRKSKRNSHIR